MILKKAPILLLIGLVFVSLVRADDDDMSAVDTPTAPAPSRPNPKGRAQKEGVIDFDADVIEGAKKGPDLFLQTETDRMDPDAMLFIRRNFNDFHQSDRTRRPKFTP